MRGNLDGEFLAGLGAGTDDAGRFGGGADGGHLADRAEGLDQGGEVVRAHVEQGAGAVLEQERRVGVPGFGAGGLEGGHSGQRGADVATLDDPAGGLQASAQERVRGGAEADTRGVGRFEQAEPGFAVQGERLLGPDVLAGVDCRGGDFDVRGRDGEVDDEFDVGMVQCQLGRAEFGDPVFLGPCLRGFDEEVRDDQDLQVREDREVVQVLLADVARADDGDADRAFAGGRVRSSCLHSFCACCVGAGCGGQVGQALGDAFEDVTGVVVELNHANFQGLGCGDDVQDRDGALAGGLLCLGVSVAWAVLDVDELHPVTEAGQKFHGVLAADGNPVRVYFQDQFRIQQTLEVFQGGLAFDGGLQLPGVVVVPHTDAVFSTLLGCCVELGGRGLDGLRRPASAPRGGRDRSPW